MRRLETAAHLLGGVARARIPLGVCWTLLTRCTRRCSYCNVENKDSTGLPPADALRLVDAFAGAGARLVTVTGGEPLLRPDLEAITGRLRGHGVRVVLNTNGDLLPRRRGVLATVDQVNLSLDGPPGAADAARGPGAVDATLAAAEIVHEAGTPLVFTCVVRAQGEAEIAWIARQAARLGATAQFQTDVRGNASAPATLRAAFATVRRLQRAGAPFPQSPESLARLGGARPGRPLVCHAMRVTAFVGPTPEVAACSQRWFEGERRPFPVSTAGFLRAFRALRAPETCERCTCAAALETCLALRGDLHALGHLLGRATRRGGRARPRTAPTRSAVP